MKIKITTYERRIVKQVEIVEVPGHDNFEEAKTDYEDSGGSVSWGVVYELLEPEEVIECEVIEEIIEPVEATI